MCFFISGSSDNNYRKVASTAHFPPNYIDSCLKLVIFFSMVLTVIDIFILRTIVNGLCYLATFVFGVNSVGLLLYSVQLTFDSIMEEFSNKETDSQQSTSLSSTADRQVDNSEMGSRKEDQSSDNAQ